MIDTWKTTAVIAAAIVLVVFINGCTRALVARDCYKALEKGIAVECQE